MLFGCFCFMHVESDHEFDRDLPRAIFFSVFFREYSSREAAEILAANRPSFFARSAFPSVRQEKSISFFSFFFSFAKKWSFTDRYMRLARVLLLIGSLKDGFLRRASKNELRLQICVNGVPKIDQLFHTFFKKCWNRRALRAPAVHGVSSIILGF